MPESPEVWNAGWDFQGHGSLVGQSGTPGAGAAGAALPALPCPGCCQGCFFLSEDRLSWGDDPVLRADAGILPEAQRCQLRAGITSWLPKKVSRRRGACRERRGRGVGRGESGSGTLGHHSCRFMGSARALQLRQPRWAGPCGAGGVRALRMEFQGGSGCTGPLEVTGCILSAPWSASRGFRAPGEGDARGQQGTVRVAPHGAAAAPGSCQGRSGAQLSHSTRQRAAPVPCSECHGR